MTPSGLKSHWKAGLILTAVYGGLVIVVTYPQVLDLSQRTLGEQGVDKLNHLWDIWWWGQAASNPERSFFFTDLLYYPPGVSLWPANSGFTKYFLGLIPLSLGLGPEGTYNLLIMVSMLLSCLGGHFIGTRLFHRRGVGIFLGVAAAFNPLVLFHVNVSLPEFINLGWALLYCAALRQLTDKPTPRAALAALIWFAVTATWCWYLGFLMLLFSALYVPLTRGGRGLLSLSRRELLVLVGFVAAVGLFMGYFSQKMGVGGVEDRMAAVSEQMVRGMEGGRTPVLDQAMFLGAEAERLKIKDRACLQGLEAKLIFSLDPWSTLTAWDKDHRMALFYPPRWGVLLILALAGLIWRPRRWSLACVGIIAASTALALGPCLVLGDEIRWGSCAWMPYTLAGHIVAGIGRIQFPLRFLFPAVVALLLLAGGGLSAVLERRGGGPWRRVLFLLLCVALTMGGGLSLTGFPLPGGRLDAPIFYRRLAQEPGDIGLVEVPLSRDIGVRRPISPSLFTYYQTVHGKRLLRGPLPEYLSHNVYTPDMARNPLLARIRRLEGRKLDQAGVENLRAGLDTLRRHGYLYFVVHPDAMTRDTAGAITSLLTRLIGEPGKDGSLPEDPLLIFKIGPAQAHQDGH